MNSCVRIRLKSSINEEDYMTHVQNNLPDEYDKILDGLEIHLTSSGFDALTTVVIHEK